MCFFAVAECIATSNKCITTRNKKLLGAPGLTTRSKDATRGSWHRDPLHARCQGPFHRPDEMRIVRDARSEKGFRNG